MSEELGYEHAAAGLPVEPDSDGQPSHSNLSPTPPRPRDKPTFADAAAAGSSSSKRNVPGGGSSLASGDKPGDPFASLIVLAADGVLSMPPSRGGFPSAIDGALDAALELVEAAPRSVVVVAGGAATTELMTKVVLKMPGGLSSFGPGKRVEALLKEASAPWGSVFESALLVKALAKRQASTVRFGSVVVLASPCLAAPTLRVYRHVFSDWRVLVHGGLANGGRDDPLNVHVDVVDSGEDEQLQARAATLDDAWFDAAVAKFSVHPWWPRALEVAVASNVEKPNAKRAKGAL